MADKTPAQVATQTMLEDTQRADTVATRVGLGAGCDFGGRVAAPRLLTPYSRTLRLRDARQEGLADGTDAEILTWLDDHSRYALSVTGHRRVTGPIVLDTFRKAVAAQGIPASTLTDNGMVFTTRYAGGRGGRNHLEHELRDLHVSRR